MCWASQCVAVGHSLGGVIVSVMAVEWPERVRAIVCLDPAYGVGGAGLDSCLALPADERPGLAAYLAEEFASWEQASTPACSVSFTCPDARDRCAVVRETFRQLFGEADPLAGRARAEAYLARRAARCSSSALDGQERVEWESGLARHPASRFLHLPLGHWPHQDAPDLINRVIDEWLTLSVTVRATRSRVTDRSSFATRRRRTRWRHF